MDKNEIKLIRAILLNNLNNNIYSWKADVDSSCEEIFRQYAKNDPSILFKTLIQYKDYIIADSVRHSILKAISAADDITYFKNASSILLENLEDIYFFINNTGTHLNQTAKSILRERTRNTSESEILNLIINPIVNLKEEYIYTYSDLSENDVIEYLFNFFKIDINDKDLSKPLKWLLNPSRNNILSKDNFPLIWSSKQYEFIDSTLEFIKLCLKYDLPIKLISDRLNNIAFTEWETIIKILPIKQLCDMIPFMPTEVWYFSESMRNFIYSRIRTELFKNGNARFPYSLFEIMNPDVPRWFILKETNLLLKEINLSTYDVFSDKDSLIFLDVSKSMDLSYDLEMCDIKTNFELACKYVKILLKCFIHGKKELILFGNKTVKMDLPDSYKTLEKDISLNRVTCSSDPLVPFKYLTESRVTPDVIFIISDYDYSYESDNLWRDYRARINNNAILFLLHTSIEEIKSIKLSEDYYRIYCLDEFTIKTIRNIVALKNVVKS